MGATRSLAKFVVDLRFKKLPHEVTEHMKMHVIDIMGVGLFGSTQPWSKILTSFVREIGGKEESTVWGSDLKTSCVNAALANGTMCHGFELDDAHRTSLSHPGPVTLPPSLAFAERKGGVSGEEFVTALVAGYEVCSRVGMCMGSAHFLRGFHPVGTIGPFGSVAAVGKLMGLDEEQMVDAMGIAASQSAGLAAAQYGGMVKRLHAGKASQSGMIAAMLAQRGFTGIKDVLEVDFGGFCKTLSDKHDLTRITEDLGKDYQVLHTGYKPYSCVASNHTALDALKELMEEHREVTVDAVEKILVRASKATHLHVGWEYKPHEVITAQSNLPYGLAVMILEGDAFVDQFTEEKIRDPRILQYTKKVEVVHDPEIDQRGEKYRHAIKLELRLKDGRSFRKDIDFATGSPENPWGREQCLNKFRRLAVRVIENDKAEKLINMVERIEDLDDVSVLAGLLVP